MAEEMGMKKLHFRKHYSVRKLQVLSKETYRYKLGGETDIEFRGPSEDEKEIGFKDINSMCVVRGKFMPTRNAKLVIDAILDGKQPPERSKAKTADDMIIRKGGGVILGFYPDPFIHFINAVDQKLSDIANSFVGNLRWRLGIEGPPQPLSKISLEFSSDNERWFPTPFNGTITILDTNSGVILESELEKVLKSKCLCTNEEPIYHGLLREALEIKNHSLRSALIIAMSAAEIAVKQVIAARSEKSEWLVENLPFPDIYKIIMEYFPKLVPEYDERHPASSTMAIVKKGISIRNRMVHVGEKIPTEKTAEEILLAVKNLILYCDYYCGNKWAIEYLDEE